MRERMRLPVLGPVALMVVVLIAGLASGCIFGGENSADAGAGQITRPNDSGLALDDPGAVQAFDAADMFLVDWFFRRNPEQALAHVSADVRPSLTSTVTETRIEGQCSFVQVDGDPLDANGTTVARYAINGCQVIPPNEEPATHIAVSVTVSDTQAWVTGVEFQR